MFCSALFIYLAFFAQCADPQPDAQLSEQIIDLKQITPEMLPYRLDVIRSFSPVPDETFISADIDGDNVDEIIYCNKKPKVPDDQPCLQIESYKPGIVLFRTNFPNALYLSNPIIADIDRDGKNEIIINDHRVDTTIVHIINCKGESICSFVGAYNEGIRKDYYWLCKLNFIDLIDVNNDGHQDLIFEVGTTFAYQPRGVYAYDIYHKKFIWRYRCGFQPRSLKLLDINGDGKREILIASSSPGNCDGKMVNGSDDFHVYLTVLDSLGNEKRRDIIGEEFSNVYLFAHDLNKNGKPEVIIGFHTSDKESSNDYVAFWDPLTGKIGPKISQEKNLCKELAFLDVDKDGYDDILIAWSDGTLEVRNHRLELIRAQRIIDFYPASIVSLDLNSDGEKEFAVTGRFEGSGKLLILNSDLEIIALKEKGLVFGQNSKVNPGFGRKKLFIAQSKYEKDLLKMEKNFLAIPPIYWNWLGKGFFIGLFVAGLFIASLTKRKYNSKYVRALYSLMDSVQEGIMVLDSNGKIIALNRAMEKLLDVPAKKIAGFSYEKVLSNKPLIALNKMVATSFADDLPSLEKEIILNRQAAPLNLLAEIVPFALADQKKSGRLIILKDITEMVQSKRTIAWGSMAQKLAHEIKTPLSTVMLSAQRLQMEYEGKPKQAKKVEKYINNIISQVDRLRKVTDTFMKFVEIKKQELEPVNMNHLLTSCLEAMKLTACSAIKIKREFADDIPAIKADGQQLCIALKNIIDNSLKAMGEEGTLTISTRLVQSLHTQKKTSLKNFIQIEIADTGIGIPQQQLSQLFQPFFSTSPGGTGLGLVITKKIIEDHNGEIRIESVEGIGTTVFISLPADI